MLTILITLLLACGACTQDFDSADDTSTKQAE
jgi:hypothetical protein